jgi:hypothetical protein
MDERIDFSSERTDDQWACTYCGKEVPDGIDHPGLFDCCGERGHVELIEETE